MTIPDQSNTGGENSNKPPIGSCVSKKGKNQKLNMAPIICINDQP